MKIGTLRNIADLSDEEFALVLQALPAIRKEIQSFNNKMQAFIGKNDCDYASYYFEENGHNEAEAAFKRWITNFVTNANSDSSSRQIEDLKNENKKLAEENKKLVSEYERLAYENSRLVNQNAELLSKQNQFQHPFQKPYWLEGVGDSDWDKYKVTSENSMTPLDILFNLVKDGKKGEF